MIPQSPNTRHRLTALIGVIGLLIAGGLGLWAATGKLQVAAVTPTAFPTLPATETSAPPPQTLRPSDTPFPTNTPTPLPTDTDTARPPTLTPSPTLEPATATATASAIHPTPTRVPFTPAASRTPLPTPTLTAPSKQIVSVIGDPDTRSGNDYPIAAVYSDGTIVQVGAGISPALSPDHSRILFAHGLWEQAQIWLMNPDGSNQRLVADGRNPLWSPDGSKIVFLSKHDGPWWAYVMNADGSNPFNLTSQFSDISLAYWSPDGRIIIRLNIWPVNNMPGRYWYIMNTDGSDVQDYNP